MIVEFENSPPRVEDVPKFELGLFAYSLVQAVKKLKKQEEEKQQCQEQQK